MKYELISVTPNMDIDEECFILRVKKIPNSLEVRLCRHQEIVLFIRRKVEKEISEGINFVEQKWFYYNPIENIEEQLLKNKILHLWLDNQMRSWFVMNNSKWKNLEEIEHEIMD